MLNLTLEQQNKLQIYFKKHPAIHNLYLFKQELKGFLMTKNKSRKRLQKEGIIAFFIRLLEQLEGSGFDLFKTLGKTLQSWQQGSYVCSSSLTATALLKASIARGSSFNVVLTALETSRIIECASLFFVATCP